MAADALRKELVASTAQTQLQAWQRSLELVLLGAAGLVLAAVAVMATLAPRADGMSNTSECIVAAHPEVDLQTRCARRGRENLCSLFEYAWVVTLWLSSDDASAGLDEGIFERVTLSPPGGSFEQARAAASQYSEGQTVECDAGAVQEQWSERVARAAARVVGWRRDGILRACRLVRDELPWHLIGEAWPVVATALLSILSRMSERCEGGSAGPCVGSMLVALAMGCASLVRGLSTVTNITDYNTAYMVRNSPSIVQQLDFGPYQQDIHTFAPPPGYMMQKQKQRRDTTKVFLFAHMAQGSLLLGIAAVASVRLALSILGQSDFPEMSAHLDSATHERLGTAASTLSYTSGASNIGAAAGCATDAGMEEADVTSQATNQMAL